MANNTYQMVFTGRSCGQFVQNVMHFFLDDGGYTNALLAAKDLVDGFIAASKHETFCALHCESYELLSLKARKVTGGIGPEWLDTSIAGEPGARSGESQSSSNGPCILLQPNTPTRRTCKIFVSGISNADIDRGEISASALNDFVAAGEELILPFTLPVGDPLEAAAVCCAANNKEDRALIVRVQVSKEVGVQRRRQLPV